MEFIVLGVVFVAYVVYMRIRLGQTDSISRTVTKLPEKDKWLFAIWAWLMALCFPFISTGLIPATLFLITMGITVHYDRYAEWLHTGTAIGTYLSAFIYLIVAHGWIGVIPLGVFA